MLPRCCGKAPFVAKWMLSERACTLIIFNMADGTPKVLVGAADILYCCDHGPCQHFRVDPGFTLA